MLIVISIDDIELLNNIPLQRKGTFMTSFGEEFTYFRDKSLKASERMLELSGRQLFWSLYNTIPNEQFRYAAMKFEEASNGLNMVTIKEIRDDEYFKKTLGKMMYMNPSTEQSESKKRLPKEDCRYFTLYGFFSEANAAWNDQF